MKLNENGLRPHVLNDLIHDIISIDEYTPKIDDDNIVVQFQVLDNFDAAYDLSSFIERAPLNVLDTEASEIPNIDGRYDVFVEFPRSAEFSVQFLKMLALIENLSAGNKWKYQVYGVNDPINADEADIEELIKSSTEEQAKEFFNESYANVQILDNGNIKIFNALGERIFDRGGIVSESFVKDNIKDIKDETHGLSTILGENITVVKIDSGYLCSNGAKYFILK